jgi:hypothetical protein
VQCKPILNCHNESPLHNKYILIKTEGKKDLKSKKKKKERKKEKENKACQGCGEKRNACTLLVGM